MAQSAQNQNSGELKFVDDVCVLFDSSLPSEASTFIRLLPKLYARAQQHMVIVPNKRGQKLVGILHETGSPEVIILCHGLNASKEDNIMVNLSAALENAGISCFRFDFSGNGESEGTFQFGDYWEEVEDLYAVTQHFHVASRKVGAIVGHSKGADVVLLYASKYHDVNVVISLSGRYDLKTGIVERFGNDFMDRIKKHGFVDVKNSSGGIDFRITYESLMERLNTNVPDACLQIDKECRVFSVHGSKDEAIPVEDAFEFAKILPNHKLHIVEGADHVYTHYQAELTSVVVYYLRQTLVADKGTDTASPGV